MAGNYSAADVWAHGRRHGRLDRWRVCRSVAKGRKEQKPEHVARAGRSRGRHLDRKPEHCVGRQQGTSPALPSSLSPLFSTFFLFFRALFLVKWPSTNFSAGCVFPCVCCVIQGFVHRLLSRAGRTVADSSRALISLFQKRQQRRGQ